MFRGAPCPFPRTITTALLNTRGMSGIHRDCLCIRFSSGGITICTISYFVLWCGSVASLLRNIWSADLVPGVIHRLTNEQLWKTQIKPENQTQFKNERTFSIDGQVNGVSPSITRYAYFMGNKLVISIVGSYQPYA